MSAGFAKGFGERTHLIDPAPFRRVGAPLVAFCGTVFVPKTFDPPDDVPRCRPCVEAQVSLLWHIVDETTDQALALQRELDEP